MEKLAIRIQNTILGLIIIIAAFFMFSATRGDSAIFDETAHIVAGYNYVRHLDYRFNPEHPPLIKMLAGIPLLFQNLNFDTSKGYWNGLNEQWWAGNEFLYKSGNDADKIIFWARFFPIILTLFSIFFIYFWSKELIGRWWALLPAFLFAFSPMVLAHGHYVTTDTGATLGIMLSIYFFLEFLFHPSNKNFLFAGIAFGAAQAIKFSTVLLMPYLLIIAIIFRLIKDGQPIYKYLWNTILIFILGYLLVVYPLYLLATWNYPIEKQIADTQAIIQNFGITPLANLDIWLSKSRILRPFAEYLLGVLMVLQRSAGGNSAFFLGELSSHGWRYYFPLVYLMKETLPALFLILIGGILSLWNILKSLRFGFNNSLRKAREYLNTHFQEFSLLIFISIYWISSIASPLNIGVRHILPTIPFIYILSASALKQWFSAKPHLITITFWEKLENLTHSFFNIWLKTLTLSALIIWLILETALAAPNFLSYFNEFFGWHSNGFYYVTDSNFDWGQDLKRLKEWADRHLGDNEKIAVDYFGGGDPSYYLGNKYVQWQSSKGNPKDENINWLAISVNTLQGALAKLAPDFSRNPADEYLWLTDPYHPANRAGTAIFIYKL